MLGLRPGAWLAPVCQGAKTRGRGGGGGVCWPADSPNEPPAAPCCRYSLLGLEQTAESAPLPGFAFPARTVLVLGREREGLPAQVLAALDGTVEIPQTGLLRSLNVHVAGALAAYEYVVSRSGRGGGSSRGTAVGQEGQ